MNFLWDLPFSSINEALNGQSLLRISWDQWDQLLRLLPQHPGLVIKIPPLEGEGQIIEIKERIESGQYPVLGWILPLNGFIGPAFLERLQVPQGVQLGLYNPEGHLSLAEHLEYNDKIQFLCDSAGFDKILQYKKGLTGLASYLHHLYTQRTMGVFSYQFLRYFEDDITVNQMFHGENNIINWFFFFAGLSGIVVFRQDGLYGHIPQEWRERLDLIRRIKGQADHMAVTELVKGVISICYWNNQAKYSLIVNLEDRYGEVQIPFKMMGEDLFSQEKIEFIDKLSIPLNPLLVKEDLYGKVR